MQRSSRGFTLFLASITGLTSLSIDMSLPAVPAIEKTFRLAPSQGSLTLSFFLAGYAVSPLAGGPLADRFGRRPVLFASLLFFAVSACACLAAGSFRLLLFLRVLQGCASGIAVALPLAIVRDLLEGAEARRRISEVTTINGVMPLLAPILGAWVMLLGSWRLIFVSQGIFALLVVAAVVFSFTESLPPERRQRLHPHHLARNYAVLLTHRQFLVHALLYALNFACIFAFISESPLILMQTMHVTRAHYTGLFALTVLGTILGSVASGVASHRHVPVPSLVSAGLAVMAVASLCAAAVQYSSAAPHPYALLPFVFLILFCFGFTSPAITLAALDPLPHLAASGSGALRSLQMILGSAVSAFLALLCARPGVHPGLATTLTMSAAAGTSLLLYRFFLSRRPAA